VTRNSLTARLVAGTLLLVVVALGAGGLALSWTVRRSVEAAFDARLESLLLALVAATAVEPDGTVTLAKPLGDPRFERALSGWYWQVDDGGTPLLRARALWDQALGAPDAPGPRGERLRTLSRELVLPRHPTPLRFVVAVNEDELHAETARFDRLLLVSLSVLAVVLAAAIAVQVGFGLRPLRRVAGDLARIRSGELARLPDDYPTEIAPLARAMNDVLEHDATLIERARTHVGNLAHGLKTPLAIAATTADRPVVDEQLAVMQRLVQHHLTRAASAGPSRARATSIEVAPVAHALRHGLLRLHAARPVSVTLEVPAGTTFHGERQDLEEMLGTVADNACKWAASRVVLAAEAAPPGLRVTVDDDGPGLDDASAARAIARGTRLDETAPGSGLGLAIASDLAALYGGTLTLGASPLGGLRVVLDLP
jgi:signal transduction histidine kinase